MWGGDTCVPLPLEVKSGDEAVAPSQKMFDILVLKSSVLVRFESYLNAAIRSKRLH